MKRSSKAIYNRVIESIAPKVKRAVLNELSQDTVFKASRKAKLLGKEQQAADLDQYGEDSQERFNSQVNAIAAEKLSNVPVTLTIDRDWPTILWDADQGNEALDRFRDSDRRWIIPSNSGEDVKNTIANGMFGPEGGDKSALIEGSEFEFKANIQFIPMDIDADGWEPNDWIMVNFQDANHPEYVYSLLNVTTNEWNCRGWWIYGYFMYEGWEQNHLIEAEVSIDDPVAKKTFKALRSKIYKCYKSKNFYCNSYTWGLDLSDEDQQKYYPDGVNAAYGIPDI